RDFPNLTAGLLNRGFSPDEVAKIMGRNWLNFLDDALKPA
ncbi:MAG: membrane dipeptidase, partial [Oceanospirillum sp.]|nr:membrane dipeptidase [Oceanospirillum sp.]